MNERIINMERLQFDPYDSYDLARDDTDHMDDMMADNEEPTQ